MTTGTQNIKKRFQQANTWIIIVATAILLIWAILDNRILDSDFLSAKLTPAVGFLGYICNFALFTCLIIIVVNYIYTNLFKVARIHFYNDEQKQELVTILKSPEARADFNLFKEKTKCLVNDYPNYLSEIVASIIPTALNQPFVLEQYFRAKVENITTRFADHVNTIVLASNVAPILGFLGTLLGLIKAFADSGKAMQEAGQMSPETFAKLQTAIQIAIITSLFGVFIKVIGSILKHHIEVRAARYSDEIADIPRDVMYE